MNQDVIENEFATFHFDNDVLHFTYKPNINLTLSAAKKIVEERLKLQKGVAFPVICYMNKVSGSEKPARDYLANEGSELVKAVAVVVKSPALKIATDFYLMVNRPLVPTKVFRNKEDALAFLKKYQTDSIPTSK
ncbi:MAG: hypothetical protein AAFO69_09685 [Bacteroidota bacterium]